MHLLTHSLTDVLTYFGGMGSAPAAASSASCSKARVVSSAILKLSTEPSIERTYK